MPGALTAKLWLVDVNPPGPVQLYVTPLVGDEPVNVTLVVVQVRIGEPEVAVAVTPGAVVFCTTVTLVCAVHPLVLLVTVTV
jgi:hypothetical protein